jgi:hypothetical protein
MFATRAMNSKGYAVEGCGVKASIGKVIAVERATPLNIERG